MIKVKMSVASLRVLADEEELTNIAHLLDPLKPAISVVFELNQETTLHITANNVVPLYVALCMLVSSCEKINIIPMNEW